MLGLRELKRRIHLDRKNALKRFERYRRANLSAKPGIHSFVIVLDHLKPNFNVGKIFRSADAFGACEVHLIGIDFFDPAPSKGSFKWVPCRFFASFDRCFEYLQDAGYHTFLMDPEAETMVFDENFPLRSAFVFGHEEFGFSFNPAEYPQIASISIPQWGKVQSLNVSVAASLMMYEYTRQHCRRK
jgi:tRNA G18 (ribose-2'-O)-methylase SpoU